MSTISLLYPLTASQWPQRGWEGYSCLSLPLNSWPLRVAALRHLTVCVVFSCRFSVLPSSLRLFLADVQTPPALCRSDLCRGRPTDSPALLSGWCQCVVLAAESRKRLRGSFEHNCYWGFPAEGDFTDGKTVFISGTNQTTKTFNYVSGNQKCNTNVDDILGLQPTPAGFNLITACITKYDPYVFGT